MPKVTVIIPNFNHARYLPRRIESVLNQTCQDFEVVYLDDASTDDSDAVFARYAEHPKVRGVFNQKNSGSPFAQWNRGVAEAAGEYVWIAEADDAADPRFLETLVAVLEQNPSVGVAYCQSWRLDGEDRVSGTWRDWTDDLDADQWTRDFVSVGHDTCERYLLFKNIIPNASAVVFRRSIFEAVGMADPTLRLSGDWLLWMQMLLRCDLAFVAEPLNYFRSHGGSVRHKSDRTGLEAEESYRVLRCAAEGGDLEPEAVRRACDVLRTRWLNAAFAPDGGLSRARNRRIYAAARPVDRHLGTEIARYALGWSLCRIGLHGPLLALQSRLGGKDAGRSSKENSPSGSTTEA